MNSGDVVSKLTEALNEGIKAGVAPGMACAVGNPSETWFAYAGKETYAKGSPKVGETSIWDLASVSKVAGTTSVALTLFQEGILDLESHVPSVLPGFEGDLKDEVTVRNLLMHESGLPSYRNFLKFTEEAEVKAELFRTKLDCPPGTKYAYSCLGFITLMELMARLTGQPLDDLLQERVTGPLGMKDTMFNPPFAVRKRCVPTEKQEGWRIKVEDLRNYKRVQDEFVQGNVHDPIAFLIGGVSGNAGLFSTVHDMSQLARAWMTGSMPVRKDSMRLFASRHNKKSNRGLGFGLKTDDEPSCGEKFSASSYGHTGFTGTCVWIDPEAQMFAIHLSNRVHPTSTNHKITDYRPEFFTAAHDLMSEV